MARPAPPGSGPPHHSAKFVPSLRSIGRSTHSVCTPQILQCRYRLGVAQYKLRDASDQRAAQEWLEGSALKKAIGYKFEVGDAVCDELHHTEEV